MICVQSNMKDKASVFAVRPMYLRSGKVKASLSQGGFTDDRSAFLMDDLAVVVLLAAVEEVGSESESEVEPSAVIILLF